jgi:methylated-DNA-[protein]-cysteine S-methyltransferase
VSSERGVTGVKSDGLTSSFLFRWEKSGIRIKPGSGHNDKAARELDAYFAGKLNRFTVPLDLRGTDFQLSAWEQLRTIPYGETRSYGQIAGAMGRPSASRAVGRANNTNPVAIIVPCHRVIGADGKLVGYAGGLGKKRALLDLEAGVAGRT